MYTVARPHATQQMERCRNLKRKHLPRVAAPRCVHSSFLDFLCRCGLGPPKGQYKPRHTRLRTAHYFTSLHYFTTKSIWQYICVWLRMLLCKWPWPLMHSASHFRFREQTLNVYTLNINEEIVATVYAFITLDCPVVKCSWKEASGLETNSTFQITLKLTKKQLLFLHHSTWKMPPCNVNETVVRNHKPQIALYDMSHAMTES